MTVHLQRDLDSLKKDIVHLGSLVQNSTQSVVEFLGTKSEQQLQEVLEYEDRINELEVDIEEHCLKVLALHQPVAIDLRFIIVIMKVNNDLERMGFRGVLIVICPCLHFFTVAVNAKTPVISGFVTVFSSSGVIVEVCDIKYSFVTLTVLTRPYHDNLCGRRQCGG